MKTTTTPSQRFRWTSIIIKMYSNEFSNEVAIITGAGQGIGFEIAKQLCLNGASVVLNDVDEKLARGAAAKISENCINNRSTKQSNAITV